MVRAPSSTERGSGATPRQGPQRPINAPAPARDRTPNSGSPRGVPAKQFQQRRAPTVFVVGLLLVAFIVAIVLWATNDSGDGETFVPATQATAPGAVAVEPVDPGGPARIVNVTSFDPGDPDGGLEKPETVGLATDTNPDTGWTTNCYNDRYFNGKPGVGLIVELSAPSTGNATVAVTSGPYQMDVYASDADVAPATVDGWGPKIVNRAFDSRAGIVEVPVTGTPTRHLLLLLREAGTDSGCTDKFPYRGSIGEVTFTPG